MKSRQLILIIALVLAAGTGALTISYLKAVGSSTQVGQMKTVYVATQDIQARGPVSSAMLTTEQRPASSVGSPMRLPRSTISRTAIAMTTIPGRIEPLQNLASANPITHRCQYASSRASAP